jgi:hypothetical protein
MLKNSNGIGENRRPDPGGGEVRGAAWQRDGDRTMPPDWKPHSRIERALRPFRDKFHRAWYPWLYDDEPGG